MQLWSSLNIHVKQEFFETIKKWEKIYQSNVFNNLYVRGVLKVLQGIIEKNCDRRIDLCCSEASQKFLALFVRIRCFWQARIIRRLLKDRNIGTLAVNKKKQPKKKVIHPKQEKMIG